MKFICYGCPWTCVTEPNHPDIREMQNTLLPMYCHYEKTGIVDGVEVKVVPRWTRLYRGGS
jgi:hypothetical protein